MVKPVFQALLDRQGYTWLAGPWFRNDTHLACVAKDRISFIRIPDRSKCWAILRPF